MQDKSCDVDATASEVCGDASKNITAALREFINSYNKGLRICIPVVLYDYNRKTHRAQVLPLTKYGYYTPSVEYKTRNLIDCNVANITHGGVNFDIPYFKGDTGWLISSDWNTELIRQDAKINNVKLYHDRKEKVLEEEYPEKGGDGQGCHFITDGVFIPDSWGNINLDIKDCKFDKSSLYLGTAAKTSDSKGGRNYQQYGNFHYQRHESCHISITQEGKLVIAHSLPKRNHTNVEIDLEHGSAEMYVKHEKRNNDEFELPLDSDKEAITWKQLKESEPTKNTTEEGKKTTNVGLTGVSGISSDWVNWKNQLDAMEISLLNRYIQEDREESQYDYGKEKEIKTREVRVKVTSNKAHVETSYTKWRPDEPEDEEEEDGDSEGEYDADNPWEKKSTVDLTPLYEALEIMYDNPKEKKKKSITVSHHSGATEDGEPGAAISTLYTCTNDDGSTVEKSVSASVSNGAEENMPTCSATMKFVYSGEDKSVTKSSSVIATGGGEEDKEYPSVTASTDYSGSFTNDDSSVTKSVVANIFSGSEDKVNFPTMSGILKYNKTKGEETWEKKGELTAQTGAEELMPQIKHELQYQYTTPSITKTKKNTLDSHTGADEDDPKIDESENLPQTKTNLTYSYVDNSTTITKSNTVDAKGGNEKEDKFPKTESEMKYEYVKGEKTLTKKNHVDSHSGAEKEYPQTKSILKYDLTEGSNQTTKENTIDSHSGAEEEYPQTKASQKYTKKSGSTTITKESVLDSHSGAESEYPQVKTSMNYTKVSGGSTKTKNCILDSRSGAESEYPQIKATMNYSDSSSKVNKSNTIDTASGAESSDPHTNISMSYTKSNDSKTNNIVAQSGGNNEGDPKVTISMTKTESGKTKSITSNMLTESPKASLDISDTDSQKSISLLADDTVPKVSCTINNPKAQSTISINADDSSPKLDVSVTKSSNSSILQMPTDKVFIQNKQGSNISSVLCQGSTLTLYGKDKVIIKTEKATETITDSFDFSKDVNMQKKLTVADAIKSTGGDVSSNSITLNTHVHSYTTPKHSAGSGNTGKGQ